MLLPEQILFGYRYTRFILLNLHIPNIKTLFHIAAFQWRIQGRGPGGPLPPTLFFDQTEDQRAAKKRFFFSPLPTTFLFEGLDLPLHLAPSTRPRTFLKPLTFLPGFVWMWPNALNQPGEWFQKDEVWERYIHILLSFRKGAFQRQCNNDTDLKA